MPSYCARGHHSNTGPHGMIIMSFRAVTLRLRPNKHQQKVLEETRLICMRLWNHLKDECIATYMETGRVMSVYDLNALIPPLKKEQPELLRA